MELQERLVVKEEPGNQDCQWVCIDTCICVCVFVFNGYRRWSVNVLLYSYHFIQLWFKCPVYTRTGCSWYEWWRGHAWQGRLKRNTWKNGTQPCTENAYIVCLQCIGAFFRIVAQLSYMVYAIIILYYCILILIAGFTRRSRPCWSTGQSHMTAWLWLSSVTMP